MSYSLFFLPVYLQTWLSTSSSISVQVMATDRGSVNNCAGYREHAQLQPTESQTPKYVYFHNYAYAAQPENSIARFFSSVA